MAPRAAPPVVLGLGAGPNPWDQWDLVTPPSTASVRVQERFVSLQGEGPLVGMPSSFIRLSGCNLRCAWCDSPQTSWSPQGSRQTLDELVDWCRGGPRHVVLTGGEPLVEPRVVELAQMLRRAGHHLTVETAATTVPPGFAADLVCMSPKLSHSTPGPDHGAWQLRHQQRRWRPDVIRELMKLPWQLKFVVRATDPRALADDVGEIQQMLAELEIDASQHEHVLLMPECIDQERLGADYAALAPICQLNGFRLGSRLHIAIFGHRPGT